jgi:hypothetical protein
MNPPGEPRAAFEVIGLDPAALTGLAPGRTGAETWSPLFAVVTVPGDSPPVAPRPSILGTYRVEVESGVIRFQPRFPLEPGVVYRARFDPSGLPAGAGPVLTADFSLPRKPATPTTRVSAVYPTRDTLPDNLLKFYVEFSAPMSRGAAYEHIHLRDAAGKDVDLPFLEVAEELWDPRGQRLTLLFDPGRIKTGLKPREEQGPILRAGESYTLVIDRGWPDAQGQPLTSEHRKSFRAGPPDNRSPDPATWTLKLPSAGTRDPFAIDFPEPLDRAMLARVIAILDANDRPVPGDEAIENGETRWRFTPEGPWRPGDYHVAVSKELEDLAGNSIGRPFEVDVFDKVERSTAAAIVRLPFRVGRPSR